MKQFFQKIGSFFKEFFPNTVSDPMSTVRGLAELAIGYVAYKATILHVIPKEVGEVISGAYAVIGLHSMGINLSMLTQLKQTVAGLSVPTSPADQLAALATKAEEAKQVIAAAQPDIDAYEKAKAALAPKVVPNA